MVEQIGHWISTYGYPAIFVLLVFGIVGLPVPDETLLTFTGITVWAPFHNFGIFNPIIALAIACTKGVIVILFFMHVFFQSKLVKMTVTAGFFTFLILITMTLSDYISRGWGLW